MKWINFLHKFLFYHKKVNSILNKQNRNEQFDKHCAQIGYPNQVSYIRILYPRRTNHDELNVAELFSVILWDTLDDYKSLYVKIDRKSDESISEIIEDIRRRDCLILIVITKDSLNTNKHRNYHYELEECKHLISTNKKNKKLFLPILLSSFRTTDIKDKLMQDLLGTSDIVREETFCNLSLDNGFTEFRNKIYAMIERRLKSL